MDIDSRNVGDYLKQGQFVVPAYQRPYEWDDELLSGLWSDIGELYEGLNNRTHYLGVVLTTAEPRPKTSLRGKAPTSFGRAVWSVVDGQQRLVTLMILIAAIRDASTTTTGKTAEELLTGTGGQQPRLVGQEEDRALLTRILVHPAPVLDKAEVKTRVGRAYEYFRLQLAVGTTTFWSPVTTNSRQNRSAPKIQMPKLLRVLSEQLILTDMLLTENDQSAPAVFDAINGKRRELEPVDLLRNTVFAELDDIPLFSATWATIEAESRHVHVPSARLGTLALFIDSYLHSLGDGASQYRLAHRLNELILEGAPLSLGAKRRRLKVRAMVEEIVLSFDDFKVSQSTVFSGYEGPYKPAAVRSLDNVSMLSAGPPLPLCLLFLRYRRENKITDSQLLQLCRTIESYLGRRLLVGLKQQLMRSHLTSVTQKLVREFGNASSINSHRAAKGRPKFAQLHSRFRALLDAANVDFPSDSALRSAIKAREDLNKLSARQKFAILRRLNDEAAGRHVANVNPSSADKARLDYSIEHVFPNSFKTIQDLTHPWDTQLKRWGVKVQGQRELIALRNNLGNYTLVHNNSALGRRPFLQEGKTPGKQQYLRDRPVDVSASVLTRPFHGREVERGQWTAKDIKQRAAYLASLMERGYPA